MLPRPVDANEQVLLADAELGADRLGRAVLDDAQAQRRAASAAAGRCRRGRARAPGAARRSRPVAAGCRRRRGRRSRRCRRRVLLDGWCGAARRRSCSSAPPSAKSAVARGRRRRRDPRGRPRGRREPRLRRARGRAACAGRSAAGRGDATPARRAKSRPCREWDRGALLRREGRPAAGMDSGRERHSWREQAPATSMPLLLPRRVAPSSRKITGRSHRCKSTARNETIRACPPHRSSSPRTRPTSASCW